MLPEIGASEILVIAILALIVIGPKDLPVVMRKIGQFMAKMRGMASEFRASFDEMARQSELDELRKEVEAMRKGQFLDIAERSGAAQINQTFDELSQSLTDAGVQFHPPMSHQYESQAAEAAEAAEAAALEAPKPARARKAPAKAAAAKPSAAKKPAARKPAKPKAAAAKPRARKTGEGAA